MVSTQDILQSSIEIFIKNTSMVMQEEWSISQALDFIRKQQVPEKIHYFYIVNQQNKLTGILSTRKFLLADPSQKIQEIMDREFIKIGSHETVERTMEMFMENKLLALPVIDQKGSMLGIIDIYFCLQEAFDIANLKGDQDIFQLVGISLQATQKNSTFTGFKNRMPWLVFNLVGGLTCAMISDYYQLTLGAFLILAMFIPLVLTLSESVSMQAMTVSIYTIQSGGGLSLKQFIHRAWFEMRVSLFLGITSGLVVGLSSLFWQSGTLPSFVIGISILVSIFISALCGGLLPLILHALRLDPKLAAGPIVLMLADVMTTIIYLGTATWWLV